MLTNCGLLGLNEEAGTEAPTQATVCDHHTAATSCIDGVPAAEIVAACSEEITDDCCKDGPDSRTATY